MARKRTPSRPRPVIEEALRIQARIDAKFGKAADGKILDVLAQNPVCIFTGGMNVINISGITFEKNVPTFTPPSFKTSEQYKQMLERGDLKIWTGKEENLMPGRPVVIKMPVMLENYLAALTVAERAKAFFPTCKIVLVGKTEYRSITPSAFSLVASAPSGYYRHYDLTEAKMGELLSDGKLSSRKHWDIFLQTTELFNMTSGGPVIVEPVSSIVTEEILIIGQAGRPSIFQKMVAEKYPVVLASEVKIEDILKAKKVISLWDNELAVLACHADKDVLTFIVDDRLNRKAKYKCFPNCKAYLVPVEDAEDVIAMNAIEAFVNGSN